VELPGNETCNGDSIWTFHCRLHCGPRNSPGISLGKDTSVAFEVCCEAVVENQVPLTFLVNKTRTIVRVMLMLLDVIAKVD
jgi:hypothetical protein